MKVDTEALPYFTDTYLPSSLKIYEAINYVIKEMIYIFAYTLLKPTYIQVINSLV